VPSERQRTAAKVLADIVEHAEYARQFTTGIAREAFAGEPMRRLAIIRALEVISEASRHLPEDLKARHSEIHWRAVGDAGNVYRHGYDTLDPDRVWETAVRALPPRLWAFPTCVFQGFE
jgi:uncharacterized protein with HEPN domain